MKKNTYSGLLPIILLISLAMVEWSSWTVSGSYLRNLIPFSVASSFIITVALLLISAISIASSAPINNLLHILSFKVWRRSGLPVSLTEGSKQAVNLALPSILVLIVAGCLFSMIVQVKEARYDEAIRLAGWIYVCAFMLILSKAFALPEASRILFSPPSQPVIRQDVLRPAIYNMPEHSITYIKKRGCAAWRRFQDRYNRVSLAADDSFVCINPNRFFFSDRLIVEGNCYFMTIDIAARPNLESFPVECYTTSILALEKFVTYDDTKRIGLVRAYMGGIKNIADKELATHIQLFKESIVKAVNGNFASLGKDGNIFLEDRRELDAMKQSLSGYISNAIMGLKTSSAVCDIELCISGFEFAGLLKKEVDLLIEGAKSKRMHQEEIEKEVMRIVSVHGPSAMTTITNGIGQMHGTDHSNATSGATQTTKTVNKNAPVSQSNRQAISAIATDLKKMGENVSITDLYILFSRRRLVPGIMPGTSESDFTRILEEVLHSPIQKLSNPESDFYA